MQLTDDDNLHNVVFTAPIGICILNAATFVAENVNDIFLTITGRTKENVINQYHWDAFPEAREKYEVALSNVVASRESYYADEVELMLIRYGREEVILATFVYAPVFNNAGIVSKISIWVLENTKQVVERQKINAAKRTIEVEKDRLNQFFSQSPIGFSVLTGPDLIYELVNAKYQELIPGRVLLGRPIFQALAELAGTPFEQVLNDVYRTGITHQLDDQLIQVADLEGEPPKDRYFSFTYQARRDEHEQIDGLLAFVTEVTENVTLRKRTEANEKHFRYMADLVPAKISNALPSGEVTFFNQKWLDYAGMGFEDLRDFGYHQMMHPDEIPGFQKQLGEAAAKAIPLESEMRFKDIHGNYRWHLNIASPVVNERGEITMWVGSTTDIQRIKDEEQRKNDFIGMVSHELKTPLTSLNANLQVLQVKVSKSDDEFIQRSLGQSMKQVKKMTAMINGFLNVSRLESGKIAIDKTLFNMQDLFTESQTENGQMITSHQINFTCHSNAQILGDRDKIGQVLSNLISNAVKYSKTGSTVNVSCTLEKDLIQVAVQDQGYGMSPQDLNHVFERYYRAETHHHISGFGIGLYLCAEIIKMHNGGIWAESNLGQGSTFYFSLPVEQQISDNLAG